MCNIDWHAIVTIGYMVFLLVVGGGAAYVFLKISDSD